MRDDLIDFLIDFDPISVRKMLIQLVKQSVDLKVNLADLVNLVILSITEKVLVFLNVE